MAWDHGGGGWIKEKHLVGVDLGIISEILDLMVAVSGEMLKDVLRKEVRARDGLTCRWKGEKSRKLSTF